MERKNNYDLQAEAAKRYFLTYDQGRILRKFPMEADERYLYPVLLGQRYRLCRKTGGLEKEQGGGWTDGNSHAEVMTLLDILCDGNGDCRLSGRWLGMHNFGQMFHARLLEKDKNPAAELFDREPELFSQRCLALGGRPVPGGDLSYAVPLFGPLEICIQLWLGDEEFAPRLRYLWDENAGALIRYETMFYAVGLLLDRLTDGTCSQV